MFARIASSRVKWTLVAVWVAVFFGSLGAGIPAKFTDAEENESTSFLPGDAESTKALTAAEELQGAELAPAVIVYRRAGGLTEADRAKIVEDVGRLTSKQYPGVVADGATAASGGQQQSGGGAAPAPEGLPEGCGGPTTPVEGQPGDYAPFVGPLCSEDGEAALIIAYLRGDGESDTLLDPVEFWRETASDPGGGLEVKLTGGAGYAADAITVFENINGTLLGAATLLVIVLLILIYRSPIFLFIPLAAVIFAEILSRTLGYLVAEAGVTINGQSSSIMSVLVLGAGTDYALLIVARYREELHHQVDKYAAMRAALASAGPAVFASAATVIVALLCLSIAKVNGTAGLGPLGALGVFCAALSMLTFLPALLLVFGRRAFWPFVPHTPQTRPTEEQVGERGRRVLEASRFAALARAPLNPRAYELRRARHERQVDATHGFWSRVGQRTAARPKRTFVAATAALLVMCGGLAFFSTDLTTNDSYTTDVEAVEGQDILAASFPAGASAPTDVIVADASEVQAVSEAVAGVEGVQSVSPPVAEGDDGRVLVQATLEPQPYSTEAFDLIEPIRAAASGAAEGEVLVGGASAVEFDVREAAAWDSTVIPPIVLVVVFIILVILLRAVVGPLVLIGTVILSYGASLGVAYFFYENVFGFNGSDPSLPLYAFVFLVALGVDYNIFLAARAREETLVHGTRQGMLRALAVTGGVITSAGIVLAGTFAVLGALPLVFLAEIGFVVAFGVLLDTFVVRSVLVPAITMIIGPRFWAPSSLARTDGSS